MLKYSKEKQLAEYDFYPIFIPSKCIFQAVFDDHFGSHATLRKKYWIIKKRCFV